MITRTKQTKDSKNTCKNVVKKTTVWMETMERTLEINDIQDLHAHTNTTAVSWKELPVECFPTIMKHTHIHTHSLLPNHSMLNLHHMPERLEVLGWSYSEYEQSVKTASK